MFRQQHARALALAGVGLLFVFATGFSACGPKPKPAATTPPPTAVPPPHGEPGTAPALALSNCPVTGSTYTASYGPRGTGYHYGVDMFVASGTPTGAVRAGTVRYVPNEGAGGNVAYLTANDGNVYMYAHLLDFWGSNRPVSAGEMIARTGQTGNATAPHLHFEIRMGGVNGTRVDPYATLRANGC